MDAPSAQQTREGLAQLSHSYELSASQALTLTPTPTPTLRLPLALTLATDPHLREPSPSQVRSFDERRYLRIPALLPPAVLAEARARMVALASRATGGRDASVPESPLVPPPAGAPAADVDAWWSSVSEPAVRSWHMQMM